jgi:trimethylamine--corrinoid protein Co-methyltransferase
MVKRVLTGIEVSEETLAVDLIKKMGFNGNYLFDNHTRAHVRELWQAKLGETGTYDGWRSAGAKSTTEKAQERVAGILAAPGPEFPADLGAEFDAIIAATAGEAAAV